MLAPDECELLAAFFALFSHPTRLRILCALHDSPKTVSQLAEAVKVSSQNMSQHLRLLREKGAVRTRREGHSVYYQLADERLVQAAELIRAAVIDLMRHKFSPLGKS